MSRPILATKLYSPPPRPKTVTRPRLLERLNNGLHRKLTLISAPAGFGKTSLVGEWIARCGRPVAWLSLEEGDSDPTRFLSYLVAALQTLAPSLGEGVLASLQTPQPPLSESLLTALLNDINRGFGKASDSFLLVLDDYHVIDNELIDGAMSFILEHQPPQMHLVITTREDPQLPLPRLRVRDQLTELRASDLRFSLGEAADFLGGVMGLELSAKDIALLENRTEGWIAGLQLAALSVQGREDVPEFLESFAGDNRYVADYLVEEVLRRQPEHVRSFLLQTSILGRLSGPLCDAVTERENSKKILETLERGNLFIVPLDDKREWYRYHHLFADVLFTHLTKDPALVSTLHLQASEWYEQNSLRAEAIHHAIAAQNYDRAAVLIELAWSEMDRNLQSATWLRWVQALPDELVRVRPVLRLGYAWALLDGGELEAGEAKLNDLEHWLATTPDEVIVADEAQFQSLPATVASARAYLAQSRGDLPGTVKYAQRMLELSPEDDPFGRGSASSLLAFAQWASGDLAAAYPTFADAITLLGRAGNELMPIIGPVFLADIRVAQGHLKEAANFYDQTLQLVAKQGEQIIGMRELHAGLSEVHLEQGKLKAAAEQLKLSKDLGEAAIPGTKYRWYIAMARLQESQGDLDGALELLNEAAHLYIRTPVPNTRPIAALKARLWLRQGRLTEVSNWAREQGLSTQDEPSYLREFEHLTLARLLIAQNKKDDVREILALLARYIKAAEVQERINSTVEILLLQALAHHIQGDTVAALETLKRALTLAEPEGYIRLFVDEGEPVARLLRELANRANSSDYLVKLLAAFEDEENDETPGRASFTETLVEPLSKRELEVLGLIAEGLSNRDIAKQLFRSLDTIKGHNRNIYSKLQVKNRTEAVARARELGLL